ncbi:HxlR family transcriptional regulator [Streptomyces sp. KhCrAH-43]|uniref:winged helix-turn-helix transcriptional regulator n=1 Tax=unclassified Streptomyces TaxID=2593676 RepID=UPI0003619415|nr:MULTISPECIES: helix-turn-helix domain-containing protein [unclassified Streptomyces]MYS39287.1 transcriptional regulator [Streptomyces sp. SID4920]MYX69602.1 transcriptional regulator [Streptomyces sp. SID8373]RAJ59537.1 HxlR family transcriptional regulator [Streptomyces sp. KhCrAH-43]
MEAGAPRPGRPVRGSESGRPVMAALDLLGRRWTMRILWELNQAPSGFRELQRRCERMSSSVLSTRIEELSAARLLASEGDGYRLTPLGRDLVEALSPLTAWSRRWAEEMEPTMPGELE